MRSLWMRGAAAALCVLLPELASADEADPFRTLNLSPTVAIFGLPAWESPVGEGNRIAVTGGIGNDFRFSRDGTDALSVDAETARTSFLFARGFGGGWSASVDIPYVRISGGVLDNVIDAWHSAFGMPDGGRNGRAQNRILVSFRTKGAGEFFRLDHAAGGLGDVQLAGGRAFGGDDARFFLRAVLKLPTGDEDALAGSGSSDWAVTLLRSRRTQFRRRPAGFFWGLGVAALGDAERLAYSREPRSYLGMVGGSVKVLPRTGVKVQIDAHSPLFDSGLKELGETAVQIGIGGFRDLGPGRSLDFAVDEDLNVGTAPDVALHVSLRWDL